MLKNKTILAMASLAMTNAFAANLYCPQEITILCPPNTQQCQIISTLPSEWSIGSVGSNITSDKERQETVRLTHVEYIDNPRTPIANCSYGVFTNQDPSGFITSYPATFKPVYPAGFWVKQTASKTQYARYDCPGINKNPPIPNTSCPFS